MIIAIHQPNYIPWLGYFYKMVKSDIFILLDNVQYEKNGLTNRVKIKTPQELIWLTLSVKRKFPQLIMDAQLANFQKDRVKHLKGIELNYKNADHFDYLFPELKDILEKDWQYLSNLNIELIKLAKEKLGIKTKIEIASCYDVPGKSTDLLISICHKFNADIYLSGKGGQKYQDEEKFKAAGIEIEYSDFIHPVYPQRGGDFIPGLSVIDLLFNCGPQSINYFLGKKA